MDILSTNGLAERASVFAKSLGVVTHSRELFLPRQYLTKDPGPCDPSQRIYEAMDRDDVQYMANQITNVLFTSEQQIDSFRLMVHQLAIRSTASVDRLLLNTAEGLRSLLPTGELVVPDDRFVPNYISVQVNEDPALKAEVFDTITGWLNSEEEARSLIAHLATGLAPHYSAIKYVLLLGRGRNGKSLFLKMVEKLFGSRNISHVNRQQIAEDSPVTHEVNNKLLNIIYDGKMGYIKDSSTEKTLTAGEETYLRMLYKNNTTRISTNALFIEALNSEPKTRDKSTALQKRLARFRFPNTYVDDKAFERHMTSEPILGALLSILLDNYVTAEETANRLSLTKQSKRMEIQQQLRNSPVLQFFHSLCRRDPSYMETAFKKQNIGDLVASFMSWRLDEGFLEYNTQESYTLIADQFYLESDPDNPLNEIVVEPREELRNLIETLKEGAAS